MRRPTAEPPDPPSAGPATSLEHRDRAAAARRVTTRPARIADVPAIVAPVESGYRGESGRAGWTTEADLIDGRRTDAEMIRSTLAGRTGTAVSSWRPAPPGSAAAAP